MPTLTEWSPLLLAFIGSTRTLTLLAVFGFALATLDTELRLYAVGLVAVSDFLGINY